MSDIYCTRCREPWDHDTIHDILAERGVTLPSSQPFGTDPRRAQAEYAIVFDHAMVEFRKRGCGMMEDADDHTTVCTSDRDRQGRVFSEALAVLGDTPEAYSEINDMLDAFGGDW